LDYQKIMDFKNILIIKMSSLGDIIHALPALYALRKAYPKAKITWAVHPAFSGILPGKPWIDEIFLIDRKKIKNIPYLLSVRRELHKRHFDLVIDLQMIAKSALVSFLSGCKNRIGYQDAREGSFLVSKAVSGKHKHDDHIIEQLLDVMRYLGCDTSDIEFPMRDYEQEKSAVRKRLKNLNVTKPFVILVPGTRGERKKWPIQHWGELAKKLGNRKIDTLICGTASEWNMGEQILNLAESPYVRNCMGKTSLIELVALESLAAVHVSCDTGPLHIANAVHTPLVALFGPTLPDRSGPYGNPHSIVILAKDPGTEKCTMDSISTQQVLEAVLSLLEGECTE
jgi:heptosyltransferase-1